VYTVALERGGLVRGKNLSSNSKNQKKLASREEASFFVPIVNFE
jgi:hypothetical protein